MTSASADLSYGFMFEEGFEFPWYDTEDSDIEDWWVDVNGFVNPAEYPFDESGEYKEGFTTELILVWYKNKAEWLKSNPVPVKEIRYGWDQDPCIILAVKTLRGDSDCDPEPLDNPDFLSVSTEDHRKLVEFVQKCGIETTGEPQWWLSACVCC